MTESCIHELDPATCSVCSGADKRAAEAARGTHGPWFAAQYGGICGGCRDGIEPGDTIRADGDGHYLCEDCGAGS